MALDVKNEPWCHGHFGQILEETSSFQAAMLRYALSCVEPSLSWLQNGKSPGAIGLVSIVPLFVHSCSQVHKVSICARF